MLIAADGGEEQYPSLKFWLCNEYSWRRLLETLQFEHDNNTVAQNKFKEYQDSDIIQKMRNTTTNPELKTINRNYLNMVA